MPYSPTSATPRVALAARVAATYKQKKKIKNQEGEESTVYVYSERQLAHRSREKAERVEHLRQNIDRLRTQAHKDLTSDDTCTRLSALAVSLIEKTCERVGNEESADSGHFGVTGWLKKHLTFGDGRVTIRYVGKSGVKHEKVVDHGPTVKVLKELTRDKKPGDHVLTEDDVTISAEDVNDYLEPFEVTAKDIRGYRANTEMCRALKAQRAKGPRELPRPRKERDEILGEEFKAALEEVAEIVGHEPATLKGQYLVPGIEEHYMHDGEVIEDLTERKASCRRVARRYLQATKTTAEKEDEQAADMVKPAPEKKPPRADLRKRRVDVESEDPDLKTPDLSLNYKGRTASVRVASRYLRAAEAEEGEGDENFEKWYSDRTFLSDAGNQVEFGSLAPERRSQIYQTWRARRTSPEQKKEEDQKKKEEKRSPRVLVQEAARALGRLGQGGTSLSQENSEALTRTLGAVMAGQPPEAAQALAEAVRKGLGEKINQAAEEKTYAGQVARLVGSAQAPTEKELLDLVARRDQLASKALSSEQEGLGEGVESARKSVEHARKQREEAQKELDSTSEELSMHRARARALKEEMAGMFDALQAMEGQPGKAQEAEELLQKLQEKSEERDEHKGARKKLERKVSELEAQVAGARGKEDTALADYAARSEKLRQSQPEGSREELDQLNEEIVQGTAAHYQSRVLRDYLTNPESASSAGGKSPDRLHGEAWARYEALPEELRAERLERTERRLSEIESDREKEDSPDHDPEYEALKSEAMAGRLHALIRGTGSGSSDPQEKLTSELARRVFNHVGPGDRHLQALVHGPSHPGYRAAVHNLLELVPDEELGEVLGPKNKKILDQLNAADPEDGGEVLTREERDEVRRAVVNGVLRENGVEGTDEEPPPVVSKPDKSWWAEMRAWLAQRARAKQKGPSGGGPYRTPGSVSDIMRTSSSVLALLRPNGNAGKDFESPVKIGFRSRKPLRSPGEHSR